MSIRSAPSNSLSILALAAAMAQLRSRSHRLAKRGRNPGALQGDGKSKAADGLVSIRTMSGATVSVISDEVQAVVRRRMIVEEYETRRRAIPDTLDAHWELAEWCRQNSLSKEREVHLRRVVEFDETHLATHRRWGTCGTTGNG